MLVISIETDRTKEPVRCPAYPKGNVFHGFPGEVIERVTSSRRKCATANNKNGGIIMNNNIRVEPYRIDVFCNGQSISCYCLTPIDKDATIDAMKKATWTKGTTAFLLEKVYDGLKQSYYNPIEQIF